VPVRFGVEIQHRPEDRESARATAAHYLERQYSQPFDDLARKYCLLGPAAACVERLAEFVAVGVRTFVIYFTVPGERVLEQLERFAEEIMPHVSGLARGGRTEARFAG
jgi:alkanesulfonate monooxygenase SsuD/methylene tetrahydromethanopterin reductase-like flavin-dependent oxidoreductase (luciferase family)